MEKAVSDFLKRHNMAREDADDAVGKFIDEARSGLEGRASSLAMIPSYICIDSGIRSGKPVIAIDAGGTNLRAALVTYTGEGWSIESEIHEKMPGTEREITSDEFFAQLAEIIAPLAHKTDTIGFCFSYETKILPELDGVLKDFSKEVRVTGAAGKLVGAELSRALKKRGFDNIRRIAVVNDTVAAMLSGVSQGRSMGCEDFIGLIVGTGMNMAYVERCGAVTKDEKLSESGGRVCINTEAGSYTGFMRSDFDIALDGKSAKPGDHLFEKTVSGAYQGKLAEEILKAAADEGLIRYCTPREISSADVSDFCASPDKSDICLPEDRETVLSLFNALFDRAGFQLAAAVAGLLEMSGADKKRTVCIVADGSVYYNSEIFRESFRRQLNDMVTEKYGYKTVIIKSDFGNLAGAAAAVLAD